MNILRNFFGLFYKRIPKETVEIGRVTIHIADWREIPNIGRDVTQGAAVMGEDKNGLNIGVITVPTYGDRDINGCLIPDLELLGHEILHIMRGQWHE